MDETTFEETYRNIKNGHQNHEFEDLIYWIKSKFNIDVFNVIYDEVRQDKMPRLNFILKNSNDLKIFNEKVGLYENSKVKPYFEQEQRESIKYKTKGLYVISESFENGCKHNLSLKTKAIKQYLTEKHSEIWLIEQIGFSFIVFAYSEEQISTIKKLEAEFNQKIFTTIEPFDEFSFFDKNDIRINFDSKENFDKKYGGNWLRYFN